MKHALARVISFFFFPPRTPSFSGSMCHLVTSQRSCKWTALLLNNYCACRRTMFKSQKLQKLFKSVSQTFLQDLFSPFLVFISIWSLLAFNDFF
jgi:uncharacterized membrane protein